MGSEPTRIEFGAVAWCPKCKGSGKWLREPGKPRVTCPRCDGAKLVPNNEPIAFNKKIK